MKKLLLSTYLLTFLTLFLPLPVHADIVTLATGEKLEGKISLETDTDVTLEIQVSASISDERVLKKADIKSIEKISPEEIAFQGIKDFKINPQTSMKTEGYDRIITGLQNFKTAYPTSIHLNTITESLTAFQEEKNRVDAGELKFQGKWLSHAEASKRKLQINAQQLFDTMKNQVTNRDLSGAMNSFAEIDKHYSGARIYPDAVELAIQILNTLEKQAVDRVKINEYNKEQFKKSLSMSKPEDVSKLEAAVKREINQAIAAMDESKKNGAKWPPFIPRSSESINAYLGMIPTEQQHLNALPLQKMHNSISQLDDIQVALSSNKSAEALSRLSEALKDWPENAEALRLKTVIEGIKSEPTPVVHPQITPSPQQTTSTTNNSKAITADSDEDKPFFRTPRGALLITLAAILIVAVVSKKMKKEPEVPTKKVK